MCILDSMVKHKRLGMRWTYIDEIYKLERAYNVWKFEFPPFSDESMWLSTSYAPFELVPERTRSASRNVIQTQLRYEEIWLFGSGETHLGYAHIVGTQGI
ncbi:hypothetical protein J1N35_011267 [Gossypium stocksii]|uniref:Uncharacterized protein n=1 Tax=Gossypium stocksii TaxID=47602 RepID=A0A9D3W1T3_9ROSI|nr:hypothetical protein J1N35_011267 [Gossypium stocksii]